MEFRVRFFLWAAAATEATAPGTPWTPSPSVRLGPMLSPSRAPLHPPRRRSQHEKREAQGEAASPPSSSRPPGCGTQGGPSVGLPGVTHWAGCLFGRTHSGRYGRCPALFSSPPGHHCVPGGGSPLPGGAERGSLHSAGCCPAPALVPAAGRGHVGACGGPHITVICLQSCPSQERA